MKRITPLAGSFLLICLLVLPIQAVDKRPLTHDDYAAWKSIAGQGISTNGEWIYYIESPQDGDAYIIAVQTKSGTTYRNVIGYSGVGTTAHRSASPSFTYDSKFLLFMISPTQKEVEEAKKDKKKSKAKKKVAALNLSDGKLTFIADVKNYKAPEETGGIIAFLKEAKKKKKKEDKEESEKKEVEKKEEVKKAEEKKTPEKAKKKRTYGTTLVYLSLTDMKQTEFKSVFSYMFSKDGILFFVVSSKEEPTSDGVYMVPPGQTNATALLTGVGQYKGFKMDKKETKLAFFSDRDDQERNPSTLNLYGWKRGDDKAALWISHTSTPGFPEGLSVSDKSQISFSEDGSVMMFGIKEIPAEEKEEKDTEEKAKFDLWHWNDPYPQPQQKIMASRFKNNTRETVYHFESGKMVPLADETIPDVSLSANGKVAYAQTIIPYTKEVSYFGSYYDIYLINPLNGEKTLVKKKLYGRISLSPDANYLYWFEKGNWFIYDIKKQSTLNITKGLKVSFSAEDWDTPNPPRSYGIAGWTKNDTSILINDRTDIWEIHPDGSRARMITEGTGRKNNLSFRYLSLDSELRYIPSDTTILLRTTNADTMASGFYSDRLKGNRVPVKLIMDDVNFGFPRKAKKADLLMISPQTFARFPDICITDIKFKKIKKITDLGKQTDPVIWGKAELRNFSSSDGYPLKGILLKPEDFDPNKKYPLLVYIYETLHQGIHRFRNPSPGTSPSPSYYVSNGYIMWQPDIEYQTYGYPGKDAMKCVLPGIQMLVNEGYIDPKAIGIAGHSWGGYQIAYMVTQTDIFAAAESGAPVSNMTSAYGGIRWGSGMVRQFQYERTQSRLGDTLWNVPLRYMENSPIFWVDNVSTPLLILHNDKDGAVPWYQGIEFIMALRRLEKEAYMFNYLGEAHGLRKRVNQLDWTIRIADFFDHHLKGKEAPDWMKKGIKAWDK